MPYVQVWIDDDEACGGKCEAAEDLRVAIHEAIEHLEDDCVLNALDVLETAVCYKPANRSSEARYLAWLKAGKPTPDWVDFTGASK